MEKEKQKQQVAVNDNILRKLKNFGIGLSYEEGTNSACLTSRHGGILTIREHMDVIELLMSFIDQVDDEDIKRANAEWDRELDYYNHTFTRTYRRNKWKTGHVFIYKELAFNKCKFGFTENLKTRKESLINSSPITLDFINEIYMENIVDFKIFLEEKFVNKKLPGQWFNLLDEDLKYIRREALQEFREWHEEKECHYDEEFTCSVCQTHVTSKQKTSYYSCNHCSGWFDSEECVLSHLDNYHGIKVEG